MCPKTKCTLSLSRSHTFTFGFSCRFSVHSPTWLAVICVFSLPRRSGCDLLDLFCPSFGFRARFIMPNLLYSIRLTSAALLTFLSDWSGYCCLHGIVSCSLWSAQFLFIEHSATAQELPHLNVHCPLPTN